ncbi:HAD family hydrolase [Candidatus Poribacteria bacterium]
MSKIKALSFDMYRTLLDTRDFHEQAVDAILTSAGADSVDRDVFHSRWDELYEDVHIEMGQDRFIRERDVSVESLRRVLREFEIDADPVAGTNLWLDQYEKAGLFSEVEEVLNILAERYPMIVTSNVDNDDQGYAAFRTKNLPFVGIITSEDCRSYKPHGKIFKAALSVLKCQPAEVLHIGDSQRSDVVGAKKAGMVAVWLNRKAEKLKPGVEPDYEITNLRELLNLDI